MELPNHLPSSLARQLETIIGSALAGNVAGNVDEVESRLRKIERSVDEMKETLTQILKAMTASR